MRERLNKTVILILIICAAFINWQNVAFSGEVGNMAKSKTNVIGNANLNAHSDVQVQKPKTFQLMPKIPVQPPLPSASKKITVKPAPVLTLNNFIKSYQKPYVNVYISALTTLSDSQTVTSYDSSKGEIKAMLKNGKELYVLIAPFQNNTTKVRITPSDGVYDASLEAVQGIFTGINTELTKR